MTDIAGVMAARDAIIQRNAALRAVSQSARADTSGALDRANLFAARFADAQAAGAARPAPPRAPAFPGPAAPTEGLGATLSHMLARVDASQQQEDVVTEAYERGETNDIATVALAQQRASVAFEATLQVRNKLLSAYKEIMSMQL